MCSGTLVRPRSVSSQPNGQRISRRPRRHDAARRPLVDSLPRPGSLMRLLGRNHGSLDKIVGVDPLQLVGGKGRDTYVVVDHQLRQTLTINENDLGVDGARVFLGGAAEGRRSDEYALSSPLALECAGELLNLGPTDLRFPALGLNVDDV